MRLKVRRIPTTAAGRAKVAALRKKYLDPMYADIGKELDKRLNPVRTQVARMWRAGPYKRPAAKRGGTSMRKGIGNSIRYKRRKSSYRNIAWRALIGITRRGRYGKMTYGAHWIDRGYRPGGGSKRIVGKGFRGRTTQMIAKALHGLPEAVRRMVRTRTQRRAA